MRSKKEVWFECPSCHAEYHYFVKAEIEENTGRLIPVCMGATPNECTSNLVKRVKEVVSK